MEQKPIRKWNNEQYSAVEGAELIEELDKRTEYDQAGYNSIAELGAKVKDLEEGGVGEPGADGQDGQDGLSVFITYHDSPIGTAPATPTGNGTAGGWTTVSASTRNWMSQKTAATISAGSWGTPIRIKGADGQDGEPGADGEPGEPGTVDISPKWVEVTTDRDLLPTDIGKLLYTTAATDVIISVPADLALEITEDVALTAMHEGAGKVKFMAGPGAEMSPSATKTAFRPISLLRRGANNWVTVGEFDTWVPPSPIDLPSLLVKLTPESIDPTAVNEGDPIGVWTDLESELNATSNDTARPVLHLQGGERQVRFVSANSNFMTFGTPSELNFIPQTDEFTIIVKVGETISTGVVHDLIGKRQLSAASTQYRIGNSTTQSNVQIGNGTTETGVNWAPGEVIALVVRTTGFDLYQDNVKTGNNQTIGTATTVNATLIGASYLGANANFNGDLSHVLIYDAALTELQLTDIYNSLI